MNATTVTTNLALLVPLSSLLWVFVLPRTAPRAVPVIFWLAPLAVCIVPLGGFLAAMIALAFGEHLALAPFSWIDSPLLALKVISTCGLVGGLFSYGLAKLGISLVGGRDHGTPGNGYGWPTSLSSNLSKRQK